MRNECILSFIFYCGSIQFEKTIAFNTIYTTKKKPNINIMCLFNKDIKYLLILIFKKDLYSLC